MRKTKLQGFWKVTPPQVLLQDPHEFIKTSEMFQKY